MIDLGNETAIAEAATRVEEFADWCVKVFGGVRDPSVLSDVFHPLGRLPTRVAAQVLIELADGPMGIDTFGTEEKLYWTEIADHVGPDWLERLRAVVAFAIMVEGWKPGR